MKKIGVLTFHRCINYGAYWQARCLVDYLEAQGHDVRVLNHFSRRSILAEWKHMVLPIWAVRNVSANLRRILKFLLAQKRLPRTETFGPDRPPSCDDFDCVVVGSDEVWNIAHPWYGNQPLFFGEGLKPRRLISYAPSFGNYHASRGLPAAWKERLRRFHRVSVRDHNSAQIVGEALQTTPKMVLDPCLQFFPKAFGRARPTGQPPFLLVYATDLEPAFVNQVQAWARQNGLRIVSVGHRLPWADVNLPSAGPDEFVRCFIEAQAVVTSFFHGCVFSLRFGRPFVAQIPSYRANKVNGLLELVGAPERLHERGEALRNELLDRAPVSTVFDRIEQYRQQSYRYLEEAISA